MVDRYRPSKYYAYIHARPNTVDVSGVFYVGKGTISRARSFKRRENKGYNTIVSHYSGQVLVGKFSCSSEETAFALEIGLIKCLRRMGVALVNKANGGQNPPITHWDKNVHHNWHKALLASFTPERRANVGVEKKAWWKVPENRIAIVDLLVDRVSITDGTRIRRIKRGTPVPLGWEFGIPESSKIQLAELSRRIAGIKWVTITNGIDERRIPSRLEYVPKGWWYGRSPAVYTEKYKQNMAEIQKGLWSPEKRAAASEQSKKRFSDPIERKRLSDANRDLYWITNGTEETMIHAGESWPAGWRLGRSDLVKARVVPHGFKVGHLDSEDVKAKKRLSQQRRRERERNKS